MPQRPLWAEGDELHGGAGFVPNIKIESRRAERGIEISVTDNGPGISAENMLKIKEPLFTTKSFGTGLGLPAVEKILEQHDGGSSSHPNQEKAQALRPGSQLLKHLRRQPDMARTLSILVLDDNADNANSLAELLALDDHKVRLPTAARRPSMPIAPLPLTLASLT